MSLQEAEAKRQIERMVGFILNEARDKAQEIEAQTLEDFNIEKLKLVQQMKSEVRRTYQMKAKKLETERAINRSIAINKARIRKIAARSAAVDEVRNAALMQLAKISEESPEKYLRLCADALTQGLLMLLESEVYVRCRKLDETIIKNCFSAAEKAYSVIVRDETGHNRTVKCHIDSENYLPPGPTSKHDTSRFCVGGVVITTINRRISIDNTLDARLDVVMRECLPSIRKSLFPV